MSDPLRACLAGKISAETAISRLLLAGHAPDVIVREIASMQDDSVAWLALKRAVRDLDSLLRLRQMLDTARIDHAAALTPEETAALFDAAAAISPEASVAFYSLGDPGRLSAATQEVVDWLDTCALLADHAVALDLGCGIGRLTAALCRRVRFVLGMDVSACMLEEAGRRCLYSNAAFVRTDGRALAPLRDGCVDLVLAVDSFPYLVQSGVADHHVREARRVLRPWGRLAILNLSYRGIEYDRHQARRWAEQWGFELEQNGATPFQLWDGCAFVFRRL